MYTNLLRVRKLIHTSHHFFLSSNTDLGSRQQVISVLNIPEVDGTSYYLGLPNILDRNKSVLFGFLKAKLLQRISGCEGNLLSKAGKEVLLKIVVQALPFYAMSVFLLPISVCQGLEKIMAQFWWKSSKQAQRGLHWRKWDRLSLHKSKGGLGFRNLCQFNLAILCKQSWRLLQNPKSVVGRIFKARYYHPSSFLEADLGSNPSFIWRSKFSYQRHHSSMGVSEDRKWGSYINFKDPWLPCVENPYVTSNSPGLPNQMVASLFSTPSLAWDSEVIIDMFNKRDT